jgi:hypothetical protein
VSRDARIDLIRGLGVLMIAVDHLAGAVDRLLPNDFVVPFVTWSRIGWSSAAEFFVFFSGYLVGLVYVRTLDARGPALLQARALHRAWEIYAANALTLLVVVLLLYATPLGGSGLTASAFFDRLTDGAHGWVAFLTLQQAPMFFEILQLYVVLLIVAPAFLLLARRHVGLAFGLSLAIWVVVQVNPSFKIEGWTFNPFAWQMLFVVGMLCSVGRVFEWLEARPHRRAWLVGCAAFVGIAFVLKAIDKADVALPLIGTVTFAGIDKASLGPLRLMHFFVSVVLIMQLLPRSASALGSLPVRAVASIGRHSLECFCMSTILVYVGCGALIATDTVNTVSVLLAGVALIVLLCVFAAFMDWIKSQPWRGEGRTQESRARTPSRAPSADAGASNSPAAGHSSAGHSSPTHSSIASLS